MYSIIALLLSAVALVYGASPATFRLQPTVDLAVEYDGLLYMKLVDPASPLTCTESADPWSGENRSKCDGFFEFAANETSTFTMKFEASDNYDIYINGSYRSRFEFQAEVPCGNNTDVPIESDGNGGWIQYQDIRGTEFTPTLTGPSTSGLTYNAASSFVQFGRCNGCSNCEIYTRIQFDGPVQEVTFSEISWTVNVNTTVAIGNANYTYGTDGYSWIRSPNSRKRNDPASNIIRLVPKTSGTTTAAPAGTTTPSSASSLAVTVLAFVCIFSVLVL